jgi:polyisoprenoid-binding protein YceI
MKYSLQIVCVLFVFVSCDVKKNTKEQTAPDQHTKIYPDADTLNLDLNQSIITWIGSKPTGQHDGTINLKNGFMVINDNQLVGGAVEIDISSIRVMDIADLEKNQKLKSHLLSADFFDVESYPTGRFEILSIDPLDSSFQFDQKDEFLSKFTPSSAESFVIQDANHTMTGALTFKDITKQIIFPVNIAIESNKLRVEAKFNIDRTGWGLSYNDESSVLDKAKDQFIYNTVNAGFYAEAPLTKN